MSEVINIFDRKKKDEAITKLPDMSEEDFKRIAEKNKKNAERVAKERANANRNVKRSHNLIENDPNNKR